MDIRGLHLPLALIKNVTVQVVFANKPVVLRWEEATLITPVPLLDALLDAPMPELSRLAQAFRRFLRDNRGLRHDLE